MDWRILLFLLILLMCPIAMSWTMRHKPKPYDRQRIRGREEAPPTQAVGHGEGQLAQLEDRQLAVERELESLKGGASSRKRWKDVKGRYNVVEG